jgi:oligopeptide/dipeptide ABC transporter ATP-binding protein
LSSQLASVTDVPLVELENVVKRFPVKQGVFARGTVSVHAVEDVSLTVRKGETLGIVGESGCGKSTTARLITRLLAPTSGTIRFDGKDITRLSAREMRPLRRQMQMMFQDPYASLNPRKTVEQIIGEPFVIHGEGDKSEIRSKVRELLQVVGLSPEHASRYPHEFSGGQRQRIGVARAVALNPRLIVCDEPVSALDVSVQAQILNLLRWLQSELDLTYVFISHDLSVMRQICTRIAVMYLGRIIELADTDEIFDSPKHPYTAVLMSAVPRVPISGVTHSRLQVGGDVPSPIDPPAACVFHPRCPRAQPGQCDTHAPDLVAVPGAARHWARCHYPLEQWPITPEQIQRTPATAPGALSGRSSG